MNRYVIIYYTNEPRDPEVFHDLTEVLAKVVEMTKKKAKFSVYVLGKCIGDFS
jgi:hypothetical protein